MNDTLVWSTSHWMDELVNVPSPHPSQAIEASGLSLEDLAGLDDAGLRKAGLITVRSRQAVTDELRRLGMKS